MASATTPLRDANAIVSTLIERFAAEVEAKLDGDLLAYKGPMIMPVDEYIKNAIESKEDKSERLLFFLETEGGYLNTVVRIVNTIRHFYEYVDFIIPNYAFSAGTVLALSGDEIYMDYFSVLGPIDPQVQSQDGRMIPALGYVERYENLIRKADSGDINTAELTLLVQAFDQGLLQMYEHERSLAIQLIEDWLPKYKFKDWNSTETRNVPVDDDMKKKRASDIASILSDNSRWHSHGIGINKDILVNDLNLKIKDYGENKELSDAVRDFHGLLIDYSSKMAYQTILYTPGNLLVPLR